ncbi:MAG: hypothetical protein ACHQ1D_00485 [Nitrososphaerales archaeon]
MKKPFNLAEAKFVIDGNVVTLTIPLPAKFAKAVASAEVKDGVLTVKVTLPEHV